MDRSHVAQGQACDKHAVAQEWMAGRVREGSQESLVGPHVL